MSTPTNTASPKQLTLGQDEKPLSGRHIRKVTVLGSGIMGSRIACHFANIGMEVLLLDITPRELTDEEKAQVEKVVTRHIQQADAVITTAAIPGRPSPKIISEAQIMGMKPGAVIIDLAAEGGGNTPLTVPGETVEVGPATIVAPLNVPSRLAEHASELYARNLQNLVGLMVKDGELAIDWEDEILAGAVLTHAGEIRNEAARKAIESAEG